MPQCGQQGPSGAWGKLPSIHMHMHIHQQPAQHMLAHPNPAAAATLDPAHQSLVSHLVGVCVCVHITGTIKLRTSPHPPPPESHTARTRTHSHTHIHTQQQRIDGTSSDTADTLQSKWKDSESHACSCKEASGRRCYYHCHHCCWFHDHRNRPPNPRPQNPRRLIECNTQSHPGGMFHQHQDLF